jgi:hypothetical protein
MKMRWFVAAAMSLSLVAMSGDGQEKGLKELMQRKLQSAQKALEGLALGDFDKIAKNAEELILVSKATQWKVLNSAEYELFSGEFRRRADNLVQAAKDKNLDGASLAYVEVTLSCVKCHKYVREVRMSRLDDR